MQYKNASGIFQVVTLLNIFLLIYWLIPQGQALFTDFAMCAYLRLTANILTILKVLDICYLRRVFYWHFANEN
ncbi:MAG: hypothetical protein K0S08_1669 [Gammaproteobacteria bacterium]|jgi:hypothetical protein|nr:hypothetical protein [Gammaproteobacteria bacterium]